MPVELALDYPSCVVVQLDQTKADCSLMDRQQAAVAH